VILVFAFGASSRVYRRLYNSRAAAPWWGVLSICETLVLIHFALGLLYGFSF
jgi:hypothetical protein